MGAHTATKKRRCARCKKRPALFTHRGKVRARRDHDLCMQCYRSLVSQQVARRLRVRQQEQRDEDHE